MHLWHDSSSKRDFYSLERAIMAYEGGENGKNGFSRWYYVLFISFFCFSCSWPPCEGNKLFAER